MPIRVVPSRRLVVLVAALLGAAPLVGTATAASGAPGPAPAPAVGTAGHYIVVLKDQVPARFAAGQHARRFGVTVGYVYSHALRGYSATVPAAELPALRRDPSVAFVAPDTEMHATATGPVTPGDSVPTGVRRIGAATTSTAHAASSVNVATIDTGVNLSHPDLNAVTGTNCVRRGAPASDDNGHGTHVAGTIAARNNGSGVVGVAPGTRVYAVKVLNASGAGTASGIICGIDWVTANARALNIKVVNMSLGGRGLSDGNCGRTIPDAQHLAICRSTAAGVTYVVAAGNNSGDLKWIVPASYSQVLAVTAEADSDGQAGGRAAAPACRTSERDDRYASFSNYATTAAMIQHTIAAPGVCIRSAWLSGGYSTVSGTSMAAPHVTGSVALCFGSGGGRGPCTGLTPAQVIQRLRSDARAHATAANGFTGDPLHPVAGRYFGHLDWSGGY